MDHTPTFDTLNLLANLLTVGGMIAVGFVLWQLLRLNKRLELVLAPKVGIEGYLNMCGQVIEADPDGTCVVSDDGEIVMVNKQMENITGYHRSELVGEQVEMLVPEGMREGHSDYRMQFISRPSMRPMRGLKLLHKHGTEIDVAIRLNRYLDSTGAYTIAKVRVPE